jgi:hypothetical protein
MQNSTLSKMAALAAGSLESMVESILQDDVLTSSLASHIDETPWNIQNKHEKDGYMWVISNMREEPVRVKSRNKAGLRRISA